MEIVSTGTRERQGVYLVRSNKLSGYWEQLYAFFVLVPIPGV